MEEVTKTDNNEKNKFELKDLFSAKNLEIFIYLIATLLTASFVFSFITNFFNKTANNYKTIRKDLQFDFQEYINKYLQYTIASFLRKNALNFKSISLSDIESLEKKYPEVSVNTITFPFKGSELINNMEDVNKFILNEIMKLGGNIDFDKKNNHSVILKEMKKLIATKAHKEILQEIKKYIKEDEIEKWNSAYISEPTSLLI